MSVHISIDVIGFWLDFEHTETFGLPPFLERVRRYSSLLAEGRSCLSSTYSLASILDFSEALSVVPSGVEAEVQAGEVSG